MYKHMPTVGVVVMTHNRSVQPIIDNWQAAMRALGPGRADLCIVEGGSDATTVEYNRHICLTEGVKRHWVPKIDNRVFQDARNYGVQMVDGEYVLTADGDCEPDEGILIEYMQHASKEAVYCGYCYYEPYANAKDVGMLWGDHRETEFKGETTTTFNIWCAYGQNMLLHRDLFNSVGGYDVSWAVDDYCWEDVELYTRIFAQTFAPIVLLREAKMVHRWHPRNPKQKLDSPNVEPFKERLQENWKDIWHLPKVQYMLRGVQAELYDRR